MHFLIAAEHSGHLAALDTLAVAVADAGHQVTLARSDAVRSGLHDPDAIATELAAAHPRIAVAPALPRDARRGMDVRARLLRRVGVRTPPGPAMLAWLDELRPDVLVLPTSQLRGRLAGLAHASRTQRVPLAFAPVTWDELGEPPRDTRLLLAWNPAHAAASGLPSDRIAITGAVGFDRLLRETAEGAEQPPAEHPYSVFVVDAPALRDFSHLHEQLRHVDGERIVVGGHDVAKLKALMSAPRPPSDLAERVVWAAYEKGASPRTMRARYLATVRQAERVASSVPEALIDAALLGRPVQALGVDPPLAQLLDGSPESLRATVRPQPGPTVPAAVAALERLAEAPRPRVPRKSRSATAPVAAKTPALPSFRSRVAAEVELVRQELVELARRPGPVIAGPFSTEVGFELLYWIPFLRWAQHEVPALAGRIAVIARGGTASWYGDFSNGYADLYEISTPVELMEHRQTQKQREVAPFDLELIDRARKRLGLAEGPNLHPSVFFRFYYRMMKVDQRSFARSVKRESGSANGVAAIYAPLTPPSLDGLALDLPDDFVAVRFYSRPSFPSDAHNSAFVASALERLSAKAPVVLLNNELELDDHADFVASGGAISIAHAMKPENNLHVQTAVLARARAYVGTYGGLSYLAPSLGVPAVAFSSQPEHTHPFHLDLAQRIFDAPEHAPLVTLRPADLDLVRLVL